MAKKNFDVYGAWKTLCEDELAIRRSRARRCVYEPVVCILFILLTGVLAILAYYMIVAEEVIRRGGTPVEIPLLWQLINWLWVRLRDIEELTFYVYAAVLAIPPVVCVAIGLPCRLISKLLAKLFVRGKDETMPTDYLGQLQAIKGKAAALDKITYPMWGVVMCFGVLAVTLMGCAVSLLVAIDGKLEISHALVLSFVLQGMQFGFSVLLGFFTRLITFSRRPYPNYRSFTYELDKTWKAEQKAEQNRKEEQEQLALYTQGADAFFAGDYATAKTLLQKVKLKNSGDTEALLLLSSEQKDQSITGIRKSYGELWAAWEKGFRDPRAREATKAALDVFIPVIDDAAQPDMLKAYACFLAQDWNGACRALASHVKYSYPDAVALDIVCRTMGDQNDPDKYPDWLKALKTAKQRRISEMFIEICDELIGKLEVVIRQNEDQKKRLAEERRRREASYTPPTVYGGLPSWAEPSGWTDFRTGEPLYRVDGRIVNANGEEVSAAWWE